MLSAIRRAKGGARIAEARRYQLTSSQRSTADSFQAKGFEHIARLIAAVFWNFCPDFQDIVRQVSGVDLKQVAGAGAKDWGGFGLGTTPDEIAAAKAAHPVAYGAGAAGSVGVGSRTAAAGPKPRFRAVEYRFAPSMNRAVRSD